MRNWTRVFLIVICAALTFGGSFTCKSSSHDHDHHHKSLAPVLPN